MDMLPQAGQGAIAVQCRADDEATRRSLRAIDHGPTHRALVAERAVLAALGGSCTVPVGAFAEEVPGPGAVALVRVSGLVASGDGRTMIRMTQVGEEPVAVGTGLARALLAGGGWAIDGFGDQVAGTVGGAP